MVIDLRTTYPTNKESLVIWHSICCKQDSSVCLHVCVHVCGCEGGCVISCTNNIIIEVSLCLLGSMY